jgi:L-2-hydroxyglutarate oxidase
VERVEVAVVGGGIIGLATAHALLERRPRTRLVLLEKEAHLAMHQSGRNSGVLHSGIYYRPGSLKARLAVAGRASMVRFCVEHGIRHEISGKVIVATRDHERAALRELLRRGASNRVRVEEIDGARLRELEPDAEGIGALHVLDTGVVDFRTVCTALAGMVDDAGGRLRLGTEVLGITGGVVTTDQGDLEADVVVNCAGLHSDELARSQDAVRIVPFRGEFHELAPEQAARVRTLIYPVPDPAFPFLGAHLTRGVDGRVHAGPNAVLALAREGYTWSRVDAAELRALWRFPGFRTLVRHYWRVGGRELIRSVSRHLLARDLSRLVPGIEARDLSPVPAGVRAQALDRDGNLLDDFVIRETRYAVHVVNAPSPAATASLEIGRHIAGLAADRMA